MTLPRRPLGFWLIALVFAVPAAFYLIELAGMVSPYGGDPQPAATVAVNALESVLVLLAVGTLFAYKGVCVPLTILSCGVDALDAVIQMARGSDPALLFTILLDALFVGYVWRLRRKKAFPSFW